MTQPGAANLLRQLTGPGILTQVGEGAGRQQRWFAHEVLQILDPSWQGAAKPT